MEDKLSSVQRELEAMTTMNIKNDETFDQTIERLSNQNDQYKSLIQRWLEFDFEYDYRTNLIKKAYDVEAIVHISDRSFPLPRNGVVTIDSDFFELEINVEPPVEVMDLKLNKLLHQYDHIENNIFYDTYDTRVDFTHENSTIRLKYSDLSNGDIINFYINEELNQLLKLENNNIHISIDNQYENPREYFPKHVREITYSHNIENIIHTYDFISENEWIVSFNEGFQDNLAMYMNNDGIKAKYIVDGALKVSEISWDGFTFFPFERIILPEKIRLGETWQDGERTATISQIDYPLETTFGSLNTIEVTYSLNDVIQIRYYYAKDYGIVNRVLSTSYNTIIDMK